MMQPSKGNGSETMTDKTATPPIAAGAALVPAAEVSLWDIFLQFLIIGSTSFGGVVPYLREAFVAKLRWLDDKQFVEMLSISQSLPGLNATNMAVLVGEKFRGATGATLAFAAMCLPGAIVMYLVGIVYHLHGDHVWATAALQGVAAAAVGLILSTVVQLSKKSLAHNVDFVFMAATVLAVNRLNWSVPRALLVVGALAILFHRPRGTQKEGPAL
jgi:chromate transporter